MRAIQAGKYSNIRLMAGSSGNKPDGSWPPKYGGVGGSNPWMTAQQAVADGTWDKPTFSLFQIGGTCWYFAQALADLGVTTPIGITDTAIGGQRIEEFMNNASIGVCSERAGENIPWWDGELFGQQILPFVDMTVKGWVRSCFKPIGGRRRRRRKKETMEEYPCVSPVLLTARVTAFSRSGIKARTTVSLKIFEQCGGRA